MGLAWILIAFGAATPQAAWQVERAALMARAAHIIDTKPGWHAKGDSVASRSDRLRHVAEAIDFANRCPNGRYDRVRHADVCE